MNNWQEDNFPTVGLSDRELAAIVAIKTQPHMVSLAERKEALISVHAHLHTLTSLPSSVWEGLHTKCIEMIDFVEHQIESALQAVWN